MTSLGCSQELQ